MKVVKGSAWKGSAPLMSRRALWQAVALGAALGMLSAVPRPAQAKPETKGQVMAELKAFKVVPKADGQEDLAPADTAKPGEVIEYQVRYTNEGARAVTNLQAVLPIPAQLEYLPGTAKPGQVLASVDGKNFAPMPLMRKARQADGSEKTVAVPLTEYRALRWAVGALEAGQSVQVSARVRLAAVAGKHAR